VRRLLRPFYQRLVEIRQGVASDLDRLAERQARLEPLPAEFKALARRQDQDHDAQAKHAEKMEAFCLDYDALVRRLAALEDHVELLLQQTPGAQLPGRMAIVQGDAPESGMAGRSCG
jgi:hypothetical protein